ncbi:MAG: hypothetical protein IJU40_07060 [Desulfovibrionaceae bacterium]|nr:hypothetical protein [Desulfovibrionaceae bacterium]
MWRSILAKTLAADALALKGQDSVATCQSLQYLSSKILNSCVFACGKESEILSKVKSQVSLFESKDQQIIHLPTPRILLEYFKKDSQPAAALLLDLYDANNLPGLEMYIFHYDAEKSRWIWPFIGLRYGPTINEIKSKAILDPYTLSKLPDYSQKAMVQAHAQDSTLVIKALHLVLETRPKPCEGEKRAPAQPKKFKYQYYPSSYQKRSKKRSPGSGSHLG